MLMVPYHGPLSPLDTRCSAAVRFSSSVPEPARVPVPVPGPASGPAPVPECVCLCLCLCQACLSRAT